MAAGPAPTSLMPPAPVVAEAPAAAPAMAPGMVAPIPAASAVPPTVAPIYGPPPGSFVPLLPFSLWPVSAPPARLTLSNFSYDSAHVQAVLTASPDCTPLPGTTLGDFMLPLNATRIIEAGPGTDVCWRRALTADASQPGSVAAPGWTEWNRVFLSSRPWIDAKL
jgi:hypothetical protein